MQAFAVKHATALVIHPKHYKHLKEAALQLFGQMKHGLVFGRLAVNLEHYRNLNLKCDF